MASRFEEKIVQRNIISRQTLWHFATDSFVIQVTLHQADASKVTAR